MIETVARCAHELGERARARGLEVIATGVTVPGVVDERRGVGLLSVTLGWRDVGIAERIEAHVATPVALEHDVRAAARAEARYGAAAGASVALFVAIGTGLAAAVVLDGAVLGGASHQAGEIGQLLLVDPAGPADAGPVTLEDLSSARGIADRYARLGGRSDPPVDAARVVELAGRGDAVAARVWHDAVDALADVLAGGVATIDPEIVVVGGGVSRAGDRLLGPLHAAIERRLPWRAVPRLAVGAFGEDAGFVGAALAAWNLVDPAGVDALAPVLDAANWPVTRGRLAEAVAP